MITSSAMCAKKQTYTECLNIWDQFNSLWHVTALHNLALITFPTSVCISCANKKTAITTMSKFLIAHIYHLCSFLPPLCLCHVVLCAWSFLLIRKPRGLKVKCKCRHLHENLTVKPEVNVCTLKLNGILLTPMRGSGNTLLNLLVLSNILIIQ